MEKITSKNLNEEEVVVYVVKPGSQALTKAKVAANKAFALALKEKSMLRAAIDEHMVEQGLWDEEKQKNLTEINKKINHNVRTLKKGGIELEEAKDLALEIRKLRNEINSLLAKRRELDNFTAEAQADNASFFALIVECIVDQRGNKILKNVDDYMEKASEPYISEAVNKLADLTYGMNDSWERELPENKFLVDYKFCNEDLDLINEDGKLVDREGRLIDSTGRYIDENGNFIDVYGKSVDEDGNPLEEFIPFTKNGESVSKVDKELHKEPETVPPTVPETEVE